MSTTLVFDLDDTLYCECDYVRSGINAVDAWAQAQLGVDGFAAAAIRLWNGGVRSMLFDAALDRLGVPADPATIAAMIAVYRDHSPRIRLAPDALAFLTSSHGYALALITDGFARAQQRKIEALKLPHHGFDPILCTDDWGVQFWKPHPRAFQTVEEAHCDRSNRFVYIADNPAKDFLAPRSLGWATVQISRAQAIHSRIPPSEQHRADAHIHSLRDLTRELVASLFASDHVRISA